MPALHYLRLRKALIKWLLGYVLKWRTEDLNLSLGIYIENTLKIDIRKYPFETNLSSRWNTSCNFRLLSMLQFVFVGALVLVVAFVCFCGCVFFLGIMTFFGSRFFKKPPKKGRPQFFYKFLGRKFRLRQRDSPSFTDFGVMGFCRVNPRISCGRKRSLVANSWPLVFFEENQKSTWIYFSGCGADTHTAVFFLFHLSETSYTQYTLYYSFYAYTGMYVYIHAASKREYDSTNAAFWLLQDSFIHPGWSFMNLSIDKAHIVNI